MSRRVYPAQLRINGRSIESVVIDPHYEEKHAAAVTDKIILELVKFLDGKTFVLVDVDQKGYQYFVNDWLELDGIFYKLIWLMCDKESFIGIVNAYRR